MPTGEDWCEGSEATSVVLSSSPAWRDRRFCRTTASKKTNAAVSYIDEVVHGLNLAVSGKRNLVQLTPRPM